MTPWLTVIGLGEDGFGALAGEQQGLIEDAALLIGGERHLAMVPDTARGERLCWRRPLLDTMRDIEVARGRKVVVLATGDPMSYGIGATLARRFSPDEMRVVPAVSRRSSFLQTLPMSAFAFFISVAMFHRLRLGLIPMKTTRIFGSFSCTFLTKVLKSSSTVFGDFPLNMSLSPA